MASKREHTISPPGYLVLPKLPGRLKSPSVPIHSEKLSHKTPTPQDHSQHTFTPDSKRRPAHGSKQMLARLLRTPAPPSPGSQKDDIILMIRKQSNKIQTKPSIKRDRNIFALDREPRLQKINSLVQRHKESGNLSQNDISRPKQKEVSFSASTEKRKRAIRNLSEQASQLGMPPLGPTKQSSKNSGIIKAFSANTHQGLVRNYNEDRVSIVLNVAQPKERPSMVDWPQCSIFGVFDGHGGHGCADYLRDHLHVNIINSPFFPSDVEQAIRQGFIQTEKDFLSRCQHVHYDKSGSCVLLAVVVDQMVYVANTGDSRALLSVQGGSRVLQLTTDHTPAQPQEQMRILAHGGKTYQEKGPVRVLPGRLSVSRTIGDIQAKLPMYGGLPNVVIAEPQIKKFKTLENYDFILLGCDGVYDRLGNKEVVQAIWQGVQGESVHDRAAQGGSVHDRAAQGVESLVRRCLSSGSLDNITGVLLCLNNFNRQPDK